MPVELDGLQILVRCARPRGRQGLPAADAHDDQRQRFDVREDRVRGGLRPHEGAERQVRFHRIDKYISDIRTFGGKYVFLTDI